MGVRARHLIQRAAKRLEIAGIVIAISAVLALLPFTTCALKFATGIPCPTCGMTRAGLALLHGDLAGATHWHPLSVPLVALFAAAIAVALWADDAPWRAFAKWSTALAGVALLAVWVVRFFGVFGGPVP